jgi:hypothetical protein
VDDAVEDGVGQDGIADHIAPAVDYELTADQGSAAAVAFFGDLEQVMTLFGTEGFEAPVVEDEELDAAERAHQSRIPSVTSARSVKSRRIRW